MFCDIIPFPRFVQMLELGLMPLFKLQDFLLRNLEAPHVSHFQLLKSHSSLSLDVTADFHCTLHVLYLAGLSGLRLDADTGLCRVHFENSLDETSVQYYLQSAGEFRRTGVFHQVSMRPQASPKSPGRRDSWTSGGSTRDAEEEVSEMMACRWLQRHQQYYKQQMLEMEMNQQRMMAAGGGPMPQPNNMKPQMQQQQQQHMQPFPMDPNGQQQHQMYQKFQ